MRRSILKLALAGIFGVLSLSAGAESDVAAMQRHLDLIERRDALLDRRCLLVGTMVVEDIHDLRLQGYTYETAPNDGIEGVEYVTEDALRQSWLALDSDIADFLLTVGGHDHLIEEVANQIVRPACIAAYHEARP